MKVGDTEVLAEMIARLVDCDVYRIEAADLYSDGYHATVARHVTEQDADERPEIGDPLTSIDGYEHVLLGGPIWNVRPPMIMSTFAESFDFTGRTVHPFVTYAVSGLGRTERVYTDAFHWAQIKSRPGRPRGHRASRRRRDLAARTDCSTDPDTSDSDN